MNDSPAVIIKSQFQLSTNKKTKSFNNYLNYMDRPDTHSKKNNFEKYQDYMQNPEKSNGLFTNDKDRLTDDEKENLKEVFRNSQNKGSILWQDVISFDNSWLKEVGVLNERSIDEKRIQQATRNAVNEMLKKEGMIDTAFWSGAIHYNTDNIHVHVALVQTNNFRERGKRKQKSIDQMKSKVINTLMDRSKEHAKLNEFIRGKVIHTKRDDDLMSIKNHIMNRSMVKQFKVIHKMLPEDKRLWKYNMNAIKNVRPEIDKLTQMYIQKKFPNEYKEFLNQLDKEVKLHKKTYGDSKRAESYKETKINDLYTRMGNTVLKEVKEYDINKNNVSRKGYTQNVSNFHAKRNLQKAMYEINKHMKDDLQHLKNQRAFEQLEREKDMER